MYHCDEHYLDGVCVYQGERDVMEVRDRRMCLHGGVTVKDVPCRHCMENKKQFRARDGAVSNRIKCVSRIRIIS